MCINCTRVTLNFSFKQNTMSQYTVSQNMHQLWNGIAQNYNDQFWWNLANYRSLLNISAKHYQIRCIFFLAIPFKVGALETSVEFNINVTISRLQQCDMLQRNTLQNSANGSQLSVHNCEPDTSWTDRSCGKRVNGTGGSMVPLSSAMDNAVPLHLLV